MSVKGFTLVELLIVIGLIAVLATSVPITLNFKAQIDKSNDVKVKSDLSSFQKTLEEFYNDNKRYPTGSEICFDPPSTDSTSYSDQNNNVYKICHICGIKIGYSMPENFKSYISKILCHPSSSKILQNVTYDYIYMYHDSTSPQFYKIFAKLSNEDDKDIEFLGCSYGCGPRYIMQDSIKSYIIPNTQEDFDLLSNNYYITSPNATIDTDSMRCANFSVIFTQDSSSICNEVCSQSSTSCSVYSFDVSKKYYFDSMCKYKCKI